MAEGSLSLESSPGEDQTDLGVIKSLESQVEDLKDENKTLKKKHLEEKDRQNKVSEELHEKLREQYRRENDGVEKGHKEDILKVKADCEQRLDTARQEKQEVEKLLTKERIEREGLVLKHQKELAKRSEDSEALKNDLETKLRQEITDLRRMIGNEKEEHERKSVAGEKDLEALRAQLAGLQSEFAVAKDEKASLEEEMLTLKARLETELEDKTRLEQDIQTRKIEIEGLSATLAEKEKALAEGLGQEKMKEWEELREKAQTTETDLKYWKETAKGLDQELAKWKTTLQTIEENMSRVQAENNTSKLEYEKRIEGLVKEHQEEMAVFQAKHEQKLHDLEQDSDDALARVKDELLVEFRNEKQEFVKNKEELVAAHATEVEELRAHYEELLAEKDRQRAQFEQISTGRLDEREKRLNADSGKTIAAREEKIATLEREIKEKNEQLLTMRDILNQEYSQSLEGARREYKEQRAALTEEHERLRDDIKQNNEIVSKNLEDRIAELKAELSGCREEMKREVARLTKEKEDAVADARKELRDQRNEFEEHIKRLEGDHSAAMELARQYHATLLDNLKEEALHTKAAELSKMASDYEQRLDTASKKRENLERTLKDELDQNQKEIENLKRFHEEVMSEEEEKQKKFTKLLKEQAKESSDGMVRFLTDNHSARERDFVHELGKAREDTKIALETNERECKEKVAVLREQFRVATAQAEERRTQEMNCKALEWGKREGELVQHVESLKARLADLEQRHVTEESEEIERLELVVGGLGSEMEKMKKEHETDVGELRAKFWEEKREYESGAHVEHVENEKNKMEALRTLLAEVTKQQGKLDQKDQLVDNLRAEVRQLENGSKDSGDLRKELEGTIEQLRSDVAVKVEELKEAGKERDRVQGEIEEKQLEVTALKDMVSGLGDEKEVERNRADSVCAELQAVQSVLKIDEEVQTEIESESQNGACGTSKKKKTIVKRFTKFFHSKHKNKLKRVNSTSRRVSRRVSLSEEDVVLMNGGPGIEVHDTAILLNRAAEG